MGATPVVERIGALTIAESPDWALASVAARAGRDADVATGLRPLIGAEPPGVGESLSAGEVRAFWIGQAQWMLFAPLASHEDLAAQAKAAVGDAASVTEQTDAWVVFTLDAERDEDWAAAVERLSAVDPRRLVAGAAVRTAIEHTGCFILRRTAAPRLHILGPRSSAGSLHHAVCAAAASVAAIREGLQ